MTFDGATYDPDRDGPRLARELVRVRDLMADGKWRTLQDIAKTTERPTGGRRTR